eukprot:TRINITY_DN5358_c1_g1_i1.p1 TRINITY_DN5358_c1_g1~~TRINITY_DN5358_c1_g1_i1.p1  ORF type:complete len:1098 (+),score=191.79 TRINITY_DN5358_c1_g1_i1:67-3360(+)
MAAQPSESSRGKRSGFRIQNKSLSTAKDHQADDDWASSVNRGGFQDSHVGGFQDSHHVSNTESWGRNSSSNFHVEHHGDYQEKTAEMYYKDVDNQVEAPPVRGSRRKQTRLPPRNQQGMSQSEVPHTAFVSAGRNQYAPKSWMQQPPLPPPPPPSSTASNRRADTRQYHGGAPRGQHPGHSPSGQQALQQDPQVFFKGHPGNRGPSRDGHVMQAVDVYGTSAHPCMQRSYPQHNQQNAVQRDEQHQYSPPGMLSQPQKPRLPQEQQQGRMVRMEQQQMSVPHLAQHENGGADFCGIDPELLLQALQEKCQTHDVKASLHYFHRLAQLDSLSVSHFRVAVSEIHRLLIQVGEDHMLTCRQLADLTYDMGTLGRFKNEPLVRNVMQLLSELTWQRREHLTPSACSSFVWGFACLIWREDRLMSVVAAAVVKKIDSLDHKDLANTAWGFAKAGLWNQELGNCLFQECQAKIDTFSPQSLSSVAWAMAEWSFKNDILVDTVTRAVLRKCDDFEPAQLSMTAWAFSNLEIKNGNLMNRFAETSRRKITRFTTADLAHLGWAFANLKIQDDELFGLMSTEVKRGVKGMQPLELVNIAWAFSKTNFASPDVMQMLADEAVLQISNFKPGEITMLTWAYAAVAHQHTGMMSQIGDKVARHMYKFTPLQLAHVAWAFGALALRHEGLMKHISMSAQADPESFKAHGLLHVAWTFAKVDYWAEDFFRAAAPVIIDGMSQLKPLALCRCARAYESVQDSGKIVIQAVVNEACRKIEEFKIRDLVKLVDQLPLCTMIPAYQQLQYSLDVKCDEVAQVMMDVFLEGADSVNYAESCDRLRHVCVGINDFGLRQTPRILSKLGFEMPAFSALMHAWESVTQADLFNVLKEKQPHSSQSKQGLATAELDVEIQVVSGSMESVVIEWSENWRDVLHQCMEGQLIAGYSIHDNHMMTVDPYAPQEIDISRFPLHLSRPAITRVALKRFFGLCFAITEFGSSQSLDFFCTECGKGRHDAGSVEVVEGWNLFNSYREDAITKAVQHMLAEICLQLYSKVGMQPTTGTTLEVVHGTIIIMMSSLPPLGTIMILLQLRSYLPNVKIEFVEMQAFQYCS